jgi:imidazole glycerol-phosphate synthase subunit HisF
MRRIRVIPTLLLDNLKLIKTKQFKNPTYIGDPRNAVKIFNNKEVDELILLDILASERKVLPNFELIQEIISEAFMPIAYGGGINSLNQIEQLIRMGIEKVVINQSAINQPELITAIANKFGRQAIVVSIDVKKNFFGTSSVYTQRGTQNTKIDPVEFAKRVESLGAGEIYLTAVEKESMMFGYDIELIEKVTKEVSIPVIINGGAGEINHFLPAVKAGASAVTAGSMFVFHGKLRGVLINYPTQIELKSQLFNKL